MGVNIPRRMTGLGDAALPDDGVDTADELGLDDMRIGLRVAEIGEDVGAAAFDGDAHGSILIPGYSPRNE